LRPNESKIGASRELDKRKKKVEAGDLLKIFYFDSR
jgi:hypothetical protein